MMINQHEIISALGLNIYTSQYLILFVKSEQKIKMEDEAYSHNINLLSQNSLSVSQTQFT